MLTTSWKLIPVLLALVVSASFAGTLPSVRSVKITNTRADWFYLEELSILNDAGDDVASVEFGSIASSSEQPGFFSTDQGPIDDIFGACCETGWHSTTSAGDQFYIITFPGPQTLTGMITVWDRQDSGCCSHRLDGMLFEYFDGLDGEGNLVAAQQIDALAEDSFGDISTEVGASFELTNPDTDTDSDGDGLTNRYEEEMGLDPNDASGDNGAAGDPDKDGVTNIEEFARETLPKVADTDEDGVLDGAETGTGNWVSANETGTDPLIADTDGDTLLDGMETNSGAFASASDPGTDPNNEDTDGDGFRDHRELVFGTDPTNADSVPLVSASITGVKSIRITNIQTDWFYLEELEIFNTTDQDVASESFGTIATASENPGFGAKAVGPIDDVIGPCCANGYHSSTDMGGQALTYTFPSPQDLAGDLRFWNRIDGCCATRLDGMLVEYFSGDDGTGELIAEQEVLGLASEQPEEISSPAGAAVPIVFVVPTGPLAISEVQRGEAGELSLSWNSTSVEFFAVERSLTMRPNEWDVLESNLAGAGEPAKVTTYVVGVPEDGATYYRIRRAEPPPFLKSDFEDGAGDWVVGIGQNPFVSESDTQWEFGTPSSGPGAVFAGTGAVGTDLDANYGNATNIILTSPVVDLSKQRKASLTFYYFLESGLEEGTVLEFIDSADASQLLAVTDPLPAVSEWTLHTIDLSKIGEAESSLLDQSFQVRFRFLSDDNADDNGAGFFLDEVLIQR